MNKFLQIFRSKIGSSILITTSFVAITWILMFLHSYGLVVPLFMFIGTVVIVTLVQTLFTLLSKKT